MRVQEALDILFPGKLKDLTPDGYLSAITELRGRSRTMANKVERALAPVLQRRVFPKRRIPWHETSRGTVSRVILLPDNPHFRQDVTAIRLALGIPNGQVRSSPGDPVQSQLDEWEGQLLVPVELLADRELAGRWIGQHRRAAAGLPPDEFAEGLTPQALRAARRSATLDFATIREPEWLRTRPQPHPRCTSTRDQRLPLHWAVARLLERHRLPHHICGRAMSHVLTVRREDLEGLDPVGVSLSHGSGSVSVMQPEHSFSVTIEGIDEFTTKEEWDRFWQTHIEPRQRWLFEKRGQRPRGQRAPDLERLRGALPLYQAWLERGSLSDALRELQLRGAPEVELEPETARRILKDLDNLLRPA